MRDGAREGQSDEEGQAGEQRGRGRKIGKNTAYGCAVDTRTAKINTTRINK